MDYTPASDEAARELDRLRESGVLSGSVALERAGSAPSPVLVRPVVDDALDGWMPAIERSIDAVNGVVAFSGPDMPETARIAAAAAAWLGDRGRTVVLVDASVERPVLGKPLPEDGDEGLVDAVLFGVSPPAVVRRTLSPGVSIVTTGSHPLSVDSVFDGGKLSSVLRGLADEALVLVLVPQARLSSTSGVLDAAVCIADSVADIESLATSIEGVRTTGVHVRNRDEKAAGTDRAGEPSVGLPIVLTTHGQPGEPVDAETTAQEPAPSLLESTEHEREDGADVTEEPRHAPIVLGASSAERKRPDHLASTVAVAVILVIATVIWWSMDGQRRFQSRTDRSLPTGQELVTEAADSESGGDGAAASAETVGGTTLQGGTSEEASAPGGEGATGAPATAPVESVKSGNEGGVDSAVVPPTDQPQVGDAVIGGAVSGPGGPYRIMVSSHHREAAAEVEATELGELGVVAEVAAAEVAGRGTWFRVLVSGGYPTLARARAVLDTIRSFGYEGAWIERAPQGE
ncbi:MAG: SPOR domain-containing protein [Candidatus Eisenbacteria bacterium]